VSTLDERFNELLFKKTMHMTANQKSSARYYYKMQYQKTGQIPKGLLFRKGCKASGRRKVHSQELEKRFIEMVQKSSDINDPDFITRPLRTIENFKRRLLDEFFEIKIHTLYRLSKKHHLKEYLNRPDDGKKSAPIFAFSDMEVFDLIFMDGCVFHYFEIRDDDGQFRHPMAISFMDAASRNIFSMDLNFSESNLNSILAFESFLKSTEFPEKTIKFRPDNSSGFVNLKRVLKELNYAYALPDQFFFQDSFAKVKNPKQKAHLESSHRLLHNFEDHIMRQLPKQKLIKRYQSFRFLASGKKEKITISRYDITLDELKSTSVCYDYLKLHNDDCRSFSVEGQIKRFKPSQKLSDYLGSISTFRFKNEDIQNCLKYGFPKQDALIRNKGRIHFNKTDYQMISGSYGQHMKVKVSAYKDKLFVFETAQNGLLLGEAVRISAFVPPLRKSIQLPQNQFEYMTFLLNQNGISIKGYDLQRFTSLYKQGLDLKMTQSILNQYQTTYDKYRQLPDEQKNTLLLNLFFAHAQTKLKQQ